MGARAPLRCAADRDVAERECFSVELSLAAVFAPRAHSCRRGSTRAIPTRGALALARDDVGFRVVSAHLSDSADEYRRADLSARRQPNECATARSGAALP